MRVEPYLALRAPRARATGRARATSRRSSSISYRGAVERDLGDVDHAVVFLSGGVDSRAIAAAAQDAARRQGKKVRTVTWAAPEARAGSDLDVAARVAEALGHAPPRGRPRGDRRTARASAR